MEFIKPSVSIKIKKLINKNIEQNIRNVCNDISVDYDKCEKLVNSYLFFIDKPVLKLTKYQFPDKSYYVDQQNRVYTKIHNDFKLVGVFKKTSKKIVLFE